LSITGYSDIVTTDESETIFATRKDIGVKMCSKLKMTLKIKVSVVIKNKDAQKTQSVLARRKNGMIP